MGEYEPNDSRNVTGANNPQGRNEGSGGRSRQTGEHWRQPQQGQATGQSSQQPAEGARTTGQMGQSQGNAQTGSQQGGNQQGGRSFSAEQAAGMPRQPQQLQDTTGRMGGQMGSSGPASGLQSQLHGQLREHMEVIGADDVHVGTIDGIEGDRIKLTRRDSGAGYDGGQHSGHHHYLPIGLVAAIEGDRVRLSANGDVAYGMEEEEGDDG